MKRSTACSSIRGWFCCGGSRNHGWEWLILMPKASSGVNKDPSVNWPEDRLGAEPVSTEVLRFCGRAKNQDRDACACLIVLSVSWRNMSDASSRYPSQTSLRRMQRWQEGWPSSQRTRRSLQRKHPRLSRPILFYRFVGKVSSAVDDSREGGAKTRGGVKCGRSDGCTILSSTQKMTGSPREYRKWGG